MEYKILDCLEFPTPELLETELTRLGLDDWEICEAVGVGTRLILFLKRRKPE